MSRVPPPSTRRVEGLDLLRGLAIALVLLRHAWPSIFPGSGVVGIVLFFTLSGYLITGVLARELRVRGSVGFSRFYARRACRLVPALLLVLVCYGVVTLVIDPLHERGTLLMSIAIAVTYTADLPIAHGSPALFHLWTLAVEEQFYLVWPAFLALAWVRGLLRTALVLAGASTMVLCAGVLIWLAPAYDLAYALPTSWGVCFVIGAVSRFGVDSASFQERLDDRRRRKPRLSGVTGCALVGLAILSVVPLRGHAATYLVAAPAIAVATAVLLVRWSDWHHVGTSLLRPLVALGTISYGVYLWNYPLTLWLREWDAPGAEAVAIGASIVAAALSWRLVERPVMEWTGRHVASGADRGVGSIRRPCTRRAAAQSPDGPA